MKLLILEDESLALKGLEDIIKKNFKQALIHKAPSIKEGEIILTTTLDYDLIISDIRLSDGLSFELFKRLNLEIPIIFSTAYDEYALEAFDHNGIAYVLKPVDETRLVNAISKARQINHRNPEDQTAAINVLSETFKPDNSYKKRILSKVGNRVIIKPVDDISIFYVENKVVYMKEVNSNKKYVINHSMDELEMEILDPNKFYRINRSTIVNLDCLMEINNHINGRLKLKLLTENNLDLIVARDRVSQFKVWLNQ